MLDMFDFYCPTKIEFGQNSVKKIEDYIDQFQINNPIIVTDSVLMKVPTTREAITSIKKAVIFDEVLPNPTSDLVNKLKKVVEDNNCDGLIVFGGGSPIDSAKAASVIAYTPNCVEDYYDSNVDKLEIRKTLPLIVVPTTAGTGSEVSRYSVITDGKTNLKESLTSDLMAPNVAIIDPLLTVGMPQSVTVSTGLDALSHALESLVSTIENPLTNILAMKSIELILNNLNDARIDGTNIEARSNMSFAACIAGVAMSHCCGTMGHAMGCQLTSQYKVPHGIACAVIQKSALDYAGDKVHNIKMLVDYLDKANYKEEEAVAVMQNKLDALFEQLETKMNLQNYKMESDGIEKMTKDAMANGCMGLNPVKLEKETVVKVFESLK
ncbi:MAG: iron-containing alcohol dehydrogenase family protein [Pleomorphochaeta sp.]